MEEQTTVEPAMYLQQLYVQAVTNTPGSSRWPEGPSRPQVTQRKASKRSGSISDGPSSKKSHSANSMPGLTLQEHLLSVDSLIKENEELDRRIRRIINDSAEKLSDVNSPIREPAGRSLGDEHSNASDNNSTSDHNDASFHIGNNSFIDQKQPKTDAGVKSLRAPFSALQQGGQEWEQDMAKIEDHLDEDSSLIEYNAINDQMRVEEPTEPSQTTLDLYKEAINIEVASKIRNLMEAELICSICTEYFVKAATINCGHSFCADCLETWKKTKKECPICRTSISTAINSRVIDSCIDKVLEQLGPEEQEKRKSVVDVRMKAIRSNLEKQAGRARRNHMSALRRELPTVQIDASTPLLNLQHPFFQVFF